MAKCSIILKGGEKIPEGLDLEGDDVVELNYWFFRVNSRDEVFVLGYKTGGADTNDQFNPWHSSCIKERLSSKYVRTFSGRVYKLGQMDDLAAAQEGYTRHILDLFKDGFPLKWKEYITSWLAVRRTNQSFNASGWFGQSEQSRNNYTDTVSDSDEGGDDAVKVPQAKVSRKKVQKQKPKQKRRPVKKETEVSRLKKMGLEGTLVKSRRSDRLIKPTWKIRCLKKGKSPSPEPEPQPQSPEKPKMKTRWNQKDLQLLQFNLKVVQPKTLTDWERVSKYLGGMFTIESIKAKANATFGYDLQVHSTRANQRNLSQLKMMKEKQANAGTLAARQEVSRFMAEAHKTRDDNDDDYFASRMNDQDTVLMPSIANVSRNDPILSSLDTSTDDRPSTSKDRRFIPLPLSSTSSNNSSEDIRPCGTPDTIERRQRDRMAHKLHQDKAFQMAQGRGGRAVATKKQTKITVAKKGGRVIEQRVDMSYVHAKGAMYKRFFSAQMQQDQDEESEEDHYFDEQGEI